MAYFKPIGPGNYSKGPCGGPDDSLFISLAEGLTLDISTSSMRGQDRRTISFSFYLGEGHTLQLTSSDFTITGEENSPVTLTIGDISYLEIDKSTLPYGSIMHSFPPTTTLYGALDGIKHTFLESRDQKNRSYLTYLDVTKINWKKFKIKFPTILFDGKGVAIPEIKIEFRNEAVTNYIC